ncbi:MAG: hypothetical protein MJD61_01890 [Proteobacteria bacterium]|nr:hypothetical protein [Pseudomonadota bacterium]
MNFTNGKCRDLCIRLMEADSCNAVVAVLESEGLWADPAVWRLYGDEPNNFSAIGNQTERSDAALVEKIVNSIDATLIAECLAAGIDPESDSAPQSIHEAVSAFFEKDTVNADAPGHISGWTKKKRGEAANRITVAATGKKGSGGNICLSIADSGEGQTPNSVPDTILSLNKENKIKIPFVQGKFNMGGTAVLRFCGDENLQFVLTKRNPAALQASDISSDLWGFTVVRRENPQGKRRNSRYTYLAPMPDPNGSSKGGILRFAADSMPIFPESNRPYSRPSSHGTLIKLYDYETTGFAKSDVLRRDGLLRRLDILLPEIALPVRIHECRGGGGHGGSFDNPLTGLTVRLDDDSANNLEFDPITCPFSVSGEPLTATIYAFRPGKGRTYAKREGLIFTVNGQTHAPLSRDFFRRSRVGLGYLRDSLLVLVDCTKLSGRSREDLFMNSRDRLSDHELRHQIELELEVILKEEPRLRELKARRREEELKEKLAEEKPLELVLGALLKKSPSLSSILLKGARLSNPFDTRKSGEEEKRKFKGKRFPTYFRFRGKPDSHVLQRECAINLRQRIEFETDVEDNYFGRKREGGQFQLYTVVDGLRKDVSDFTGPVLDRGSGSIRVALPPNAEVADRLEYVAVIDDCSRVDPIENHFSILVKRPSEGRKRDSSKRDKSKNPKGDGDDSKSESGFSLPPVVRVYEEEWGKHEPAFDRFAALRIVNAGDSEENGGKPKFDFYVNCDNMYLKSEAKGRAEDVKLVEAQFVYGMVLVGLGLLHEDSQRKEADEGRMSVEDQAEQFSRAIAPFMMTIVSDLGGLQFDGDQAEPA